MKKIVLAVACITLAFIWGVTFEGNFKEAIETPQVKGFITFLGMVWLVIIYLLVKEHRGKF